MSDTKPPTAPTFSRRPQLIQASRYEALAVRARSLLLQSGCSRPSWTVFQPAPRRLEEQQDHRANPLKFVLAAYPQFRDGGADFDLVVLWLSTDFELTNHEVGHLCFTDIWFLAQLRELEQGRARERLWHKVQRAREALEAMPVDERRYALLKALSVFDVFKPTELDATGSPDCNTRKREEGQGTEPPCPVLDAIDVTALAAQDPTSQPEKQAPEVAQEINFSAIADALLQTKSPQLGPSKLVRYMADKESAEWFDVAEECCTKGDVSERAVQSLRTRTNNALLLIKGPTSDSARRLSFRFVGCRIVRQIKSV